MGRRLRFLPIFLFFCGFQTLAEEPSSSFTCVFWNIKNYTGLIASDESGLTAPNERPDGPPRKPAAAAELISRTLLEAAPDLLVMAEMGSREDLAYLQGELKSGGLQLPYSEWLDGPDPDRHLALLS